MSPRTLKLEFLSDGRRVRVESEVEFSGRKRWRSRVGEVNDGGSIPWWVPGGIGTPYTTRSRRAFCLHDSGYRKARETTLWSAFLSRRRAIQDRVLLEVAIVDGEALWRAALFYLLLRLCGANAWRDHGRRNAAAKGKPA